MKSDGSPYTEPYFRTVVVDHTHTGASTVSVEDRFIIPDDGIVKMTIVPRPGDLHIHVRVSVSEASCVRCASQRNELFHTDQAGKSDPLLNAESTDERLIFFWFDRVVVRNNEAITQLYAVLISLSTGILGLNKNVQASFSKSHTSGKRKVPLFISRPQYHVEGQCNVMTNKCFSF